MTQPPIYFNQQRGAVRHIKRFKKTADQLPHNMRNMLQSKSGKRKDDEFGGSVSARLAEMALLGEESMDNFGHPGTASSNKRGRSGFLSSGKLSSIASNPYTFTDSRLNALKHITDTLINDLQEYLNRFLFANMKPILAGSIIFELHADWSDLTELVSYDEFPTWRTKHGRDGAGRPARKQSITDDDTMSVTSSIGGESHTNSILSFGQPSSIRSSKKSEKSHRTTYVPPKLDPITEEKNNTRKNSNISYNDGDLNSLNQLDSTSQHKNTIQFSGIPPINEHVSRKGQSHKKHSILKSHSNSIVAGSASAPVSTGVIQTSLMSQSQNSINANLEASRITANSSNLSGWAVTFNLSNNLYEEKGWTIFTERLTESPIDYERRALRSLNKSLNSIEEVRIKNERFGFIKLNKIRFYGDHKRELIEKYKTSTLKPKKSNFVMAIQRRELPKPLDYESVVEILYTAPPVSALPSAIGNISSLSGPSNTDPIVNISGAQQQRLLCSTHTSDGTFIVYYPSGRLAVQCINVWGYNYENSPSSSLLNNTVGSITLINANPIVEPKLPVDPFKATVQSNTSTSNTSNQNLSTNQQKSDSLLVNASSNASTLKFDTINIRDAYTTLIYDDVKPRMELAGSVTGSMNTPAPPKNVCEGRLLALITSTGYCLCYRRNGTLRFICSEQGGYICGEKGFAVFQWKWDENVSVYKQRTKNELKAQLNDYVSIEYIDPYNIIMKYECNKEVFEMNLGITKDNVNKIGDLLSKIASDTPLTSKAGLHKLNKSHQKQPQITDKSQPQIRFEGDEVKPKPKNKKSQQLDQQQLQQLQQQQLLQQQQSNIELRNEQRVLVEQLLDNSITYKDVPAMKELLVIQKKIRSLIDDWLQHCRYALGVLEPNMYILPDFPKSHNLNEYHAYFNKVTIFRRKSKSAELKKRESRPSIPVLSIMPERSKSAFLNRGRLKNQKDLADRIREFKKEMNSFRFGEEGSGEGKRRRKKFSSPTKNASRSLMTAPVKEEPKFIRLSRSRSSANIKLTLAEEQCPITLRYKMLFDRKIECKCKRNVVPVIHDVEFEKFLQKTPPDQLIVIAVINSNEPSISHIENSFENLYEHFNRNRSRPCAQSLKEEYRFLFYDVLTATNNSNHYQPILTQRHNVIPGMVLMYQGAKLVFCDHIFNGYGYSLNDFIKQLHQSQLDAKAGKFLPYNFRFNRPRGISGARAAWGGEIGGLLVVKANSNISSAQTITTSLDSFNIRKKSAPSFKKENSSINLNSQSQNYLQLPKIQQQKSIET